MAESAAHFVPAVRLRHFCVLLENGPSYNFYLPESTYELTFLHATKPITIVTREGGVDDSADALPSNVELATHVSDYRFWTVPDEDYRVIDWTCSALDIVHIIFKYKVVYVRNSLPDALRLLKHVYTAWTSQSGVDA